MKNTIGAILKDAINELGKTQQCIAMELFEKECVGADSTAESRLSEILRDKEKGVKFFMSDDTRKQGLFQILKLSKEQIAEIESLLSHSGTNRQIIIAGFDWSLDSDKITGVLEFVEQHNTRDIILVIRKEHESLLHLGFQKHDRFSHETVQDIEAGVDRLKGYDGTVLSRKRYVSFKQWCVTEFDDDGRLVFWDYDNKEITFEFPDLVQYPVPEKVSCTIASLNFPSRVDILRNRDVFKHVSVLKSVEQTFPKFQEYLQAYRSRHYYESPVLQEMNEYLDEPTEWSERFQLQFDLLDVEFAKQKPFAWRKHQAESLGFEAVCLIEEKEELDWVKAVLRIEEQLESKLEVVNQEYLDAQLECASREEIQGAWCCDGVVHLINPQIPDLPEHKAVQIHTIEVKEPAIQKLWDIVRHWDEIQYMNDPLLRSAIESLKEEYSESVLVHARETLHQNLPRTWQPINKQIATTDICFLKEWFAKTDPVPKVSFVWDSNPDGHMVESAQAQYGFKKVPVSLRLKRFQNDKLKLWSTAGYWNNDWSIPNLTLPSIDVGSVGAELPMKLVKAWVYSMNPDTYGTYIHRHRNKSRSSSHEQEYEVDPTVHQDLALFWNAMRKALNHNDCLFTSCEYALLQINTDLFVKIEMEQTNFESENFEIGISGKKCDSQFEPKYDRKHLPSEIKLLTHKCMTTFTFVTSPYGI